MHSPDQFHIYQSNHYAVGRRLCSLWISSHYRIRQHYNLQLALQSSRNGVITEASNISLELHIIQQPTGLVQSFKQSMKKSKLPPRPALQEFLMQYRRTPLNTGFSPSQLLNSRQIRTKIDSLLPSPAHIAQERQATDATKSKQKEQSTVQHVCTRYSVGTPCHAVYWGPRHTNSPR